jgi:hypothetical protein
MSESYLAALLAERDGYIVRNLPDRVAACDAEIERVSALVEATPADAVEDAPADDEGSDDPDAHGAIDDRPRARRRRRVDPTVETATEL